MGKTSKDVDVTQEGIDKGMYAGSADSRDLNLDYSKSFYNFLTGGGQDQISQSMTQNARSQAQEAFSPYGVAMQDYARQQSEDMRRQTEQRLAGSGILGTGSGAANRAIAQGIASPYAQANVNLAQQYGNLYQSSYGNLLGNLGQMSQQQILAPQIQTQKTGWGTALDVGTQLGGAAIGAAAMGSDIALKEKIVKDLKLTEDLLKLNAYKFQYKGYDRQESGIIAQELEKTAWADAVVNVGGIKAIDTMRLSCMMLGAMSELAKKIDKMEAK